MTSSLRFKRIILLGLLSFVISLPAPLLATETVHYGKVIGVTDGDTIKILEHREMLKVRLAEVDAPETGQAFGTQAKKALSDLVFGKEVRVIERDQDRYGRMVGVVYVDNQSVNREMVRQGMAWVYRRYATEIAFFQLEEEAKAQKRGLWADPHAIPPWDYRHGSGKTENAPREIAAPPVVPIIGNAQSKIYHWQGCPNYKRISTLHQVFFKSRAEAEEAGFRAARNCL
jgi:endonuclease YncB( thermonuclease family)